MTGQTFFRDEALKSARGELRQQLASAQLFSLHNLYLETETGEDLYFVDHPNMGDLSIALPFDSMWFEWMYSFGGENEKKRFDTLATLVISEKIDGGWLLTYRFFNWMTKELFHSMAPTKIGQKVQGVLITDTIVDKISLEFPSALELPFAYAVRLDESGKIDGEFSTHDVGNDEFLKVMRVRGDHVVIARRYRHQLSMTNFALALLNTKNVEMIDSDPPKKNHRQRRRKKRNKGQRHYTLSIRPGSQRSARSGDTQPSGVKNSFHIARGHFKTYTEDAPLFGSLVGTWWWQAQVRGSKSAGTVTKDYEIHLPKEEE